MAVLVAEKCQSSSFIFEAEKAVLPADPYSDCWHLRECLWKELQQGRMHHTWKIFCLQPLLRENLFACGTVVGGPPGAHGLIR